MQRHSIKSLDFELNSGKALNRKEFQTELKKISQYGTTTHTTTVQ